MYRFLYIVLNFLLRPFIKMDIINKENIPQDTNYIIVANHLSNFDPLLLAMKWEERLFFMAKEELFNVFFIGWVLKKVEMIAVRRGESDRKAVKESLKYLKDGKILALFPEGTRNRSQEILLPFHGGAAFFAKSANLQVLPVAIKGTKQIKPAFFNKVTFTVGQPLKVTDYYEGKISSKELEDFTGLLRDKMIDLLNNQDENNQS